LTLASFLNAGMFVRIVEEGRRVVVKVVSVGSAEPPILVERADGSRRAVTRSEIAAIVRA
jgi:hypothetical protein